MSAFALIGGVLIASSPFRRVGDAGEYLAMTDQLARLHRPSLSPSDLERVVHMFQSLGSGYGDALIERPQLWSNGRLDFLHFWGYSALVVPAYWATSVVGMHPHVAFAITNLALLTASFTIVRRRIGALPAVLIFGGPIIWWLDKPHTEAFTFALLAAAMALLDRRPGIAMVLTAIASLQNPPIALTLPVMFAAVVACDRTQRRSVPLRRAAVLSIGIAALHPLYYLGRLGVLTPQVLTDDAVLHVPSRPELGAFVWDPNVGLLWGFPLLVPLALGAVAAAASRLGRRTLTPAVVASLPIAVVFAAGFAQTANINSGGTFGMGRYALWFVPLTVPCFERWNAAGRPVGAALAIGTVASVTVSVAVAHPRHGDHFAGGPSYAARALWEHAPSLDNPLVEIFVERLHAGRSDVVASATPSCSKVLLVDGRAPPECPIGPVPASCSRSGALCYANRADDGYRFTTAPTGGALGW